ncbi:histidine-type phosphatase [Sphingomonas sanguinis]|uniref:histidine-type phosphatase n=1 Tax=Sphingomonas sanguinis TaxID=33051 RepID=UPI001C57EDF9|nr:histidine-type phosphatase [Sphingomonas sanguinis]QXT34210.1 histidine-type phosphatase [Sphingomonas sanguinis]
MIALPRRLRAPLALFALSMLAVPVAAQKAPAPQGLTLDRVVVLMRHGVRAPLDGEVPHGTRTAKPWPIWTTPESELTPHGAEALAAEARADRADWIARGLLTRNCPAPGSIRIWTNSSSRTIASGEAYAKALAPGCAVPVAHNPLGQVDPLFEPLRARATRFDATTAVADIDRFTGGMDALVARNRPALQLLNRVLGCGDAKGCDPAGPARLTPSADGHGIDLTGPIRTASGTAQVLLLQYAEGLSPSVGGLPVDGAVLARLGAVHAALFDVYSRSPYMAAHQSAAFGRHMIEALTARDGAKIDMLVGHDTNVTALAALLGFDLVAPGYATNDAAPGGAILIERWHDAKGRAFVTVRYRTQSPEQIRAHAAAVSVKPVQVRGCPADAPCPLDRFVTLFGERLAPLAR